MTAAPATNKRLTMLEAMIAKGTTDPFVRYARALELRGLERLDEAAAAFEELRTLHSRYVPTYLMAGQTLVSLGRTDDARAWLTQGVEVAREERDEHARSELQQALDAL
jgi:tetratricopeptide (TPR) repeat protein